MTRLALVGAFGAVACSQYHVALTPRPPTITPDQRVAMFHALKPAKALSLQTSTDDGQTWEWVGSSIVLANQQEVVSPEDLAPLVADTSETMRAARRSVAARKKRNVAWVMTVVVASGGLIMSGFSDQLKINSSAGWLITLGSALIGSTAIRRYQRIELEERRTAFRHYTRDLGEYLNVCAQGLVVVPCEPSLPNGALSMW